MNARERAAVQELLASVRAATIALEVACDTYSAQFIGEQELQAQEAIEKSYRREDRIDQYRSAMEDRH